MNKTQRILTSALTNLVLVFTIIVVAVSTIIDPAAVTASSVINGVIYTGDTNSKNVSLMINVYWGTEYIDGILKAFDDAGMKTTFFIGGTWAEKNQDTLQKIIDHGHEIGSHGYNHKDHDKLSSEQNYKEISNTHNLIKQITGKDMTLFAPPSGAYNSLTVATATRLGYKTIMWTRDTIDWRDKDSSLIFTRATNKMKGGDLILMHPTEHTMKALPRILDYIKSEGLTCNSVSETIKGVIV